MTDRTQWNAARNRLHQLLYRITRDDLPDRVNTLERHLAQVTDDAALFTDAQLAEWVGAVVDKVLFIPGLGLQYDTEAMALALHDILAVAPTAENVMTPKELLRDILAYLGGQPSTLQTPDTVDPVAAYVEANTPQGLVRRPGDLLKEAVLFAVGKVPDADPVAWAYAADHYAKLLAQGAHPEPTDLPMDGSDATASQLLETAVRALEDFGRDRPLAGGGYRQDRLDRMAGALRTSVWLRACMNGSAKVTDMAPPGPDEVRVSITLGDGPLRFTDPDLRSDNGELPAGDAPAPPMVGRWEMSEWDADNGVSAEPYGLQPDDMVVVAAEPDGPYQLDRAGAFYWGPNALAGKTIRWWRRASEQEVQLGKPLQKTRTDTFPMSDTPAEPERRYGNPTWADFDRLAARVDQLAGRT